MSELSEDKQAREMIAEVIMGWESDYEIWVTQPDGRGFIYKRDWYPEQDEHQAMQIVDAISELGWYIQLMQRPSMDRHHWTANGGQQHSCTMTNPRAQVGERMAVHGVGDSRSRAIFAAAVEVAKALKGEGS